MPPRCGDRSYGQLIVLPSCPILRGACRGVNIETPASLHPRREFRGRPPSLPIWSPQTPLGRYRTPRSRHRRMKARRTSSLRRSATRRTPRNSRNPSFAYNEGCAPRLSTLPPSVISPRAPWRRFQGRRLLSIRLPSSLCWSALRRSQIRRLSCASIHFVPAGGQRTHDSLPQTKCNIRRQ